MIGKSEYLIVNLLLWGELCGVLKVCKDGDKYGWCESGWWFKIGGIGKEFLVL